MQLGPGAAHALLHPPAPANERGVAVLMCPPFGWEEMCSYRGRWAWAQALAQAGYACARLDLPGTGDSPGGPEARTLPAWTGAVADAAAWLAQSTGAGRVVALGLGLGGFVAALAAQDGALIDDLLLWGVPRTGKALLRAARAYAGVVGGALSRGRSAWRAGRGRTRPDWLSPAGGDRARAGAWQHCNPSCGRVMIRVIRC